MWEEGGHFGASARRVREGGDPYVIVIPPPNVTSVLHMGHGLNNTIQDVLIRWRRMQGRVTLWVPGTDHAGIATQNVVEKRLAAEGKTRHDLGRDAFIERVWQHVHDTGGRILNQLKAIGCSCDWSRTRFTLDEGLSRAVREIFVRLHEDDLVYRGEYIINWCPRCLTALSNEEAEGAEVQGSLWHIRYPLASGHAEAAASARAAGADAVAELSGGRWHITVSTTRPETMLGDTGVAVHPADPRYGALVGATVELPLTGRTIPIVADEHVSAEFGTGMVKVTPAHDPNDFEIASRTGLDLLNVMTERAVMNENAPEAFRGLAREDAREAVVAALTAEGLLAGRDDHDHGVPGCYRCDTVVEPRLSEQWFVRMEPLARRALQASRDGTITFVPDRWTRVYEHWMENIRDWCISRQLWWGHRIPVWYCGDCGAVMACREDPEACGECGSASLEQDPDVLDTWFSSWLWPFSVFGWPERTRDLEAFYPGHTLSTAPEILFFWVARMIMSGYHAMGAEPFRRVYLHGTVR
ncbi:MAG: valine--tRNA ligase, partial [Gemmatimonadetes bacterium]|nr:valine--tRNA ligase [Gemmatimonadota bacterium]